MVRINQIALNTFRESVRSKILYSVFFFLVALLGLSAFFGTVTMGERGIVIRDFGLFAISFFSVAYAVISGASLLNKELSKKTIYTLLSKAVHRSEFVVGKYLGMLFTAILLIVIMGLSLMVFEGFVEGKTDFILGQAFFGIACQLVIVCALALFFSSIVVTPVLSGAFSFGVFLAGRSTEQLLTLIDERQVMGAKSLMLNTVYYFLPHLNKLDYSDMSVYGQAVDPMSYVWSLAYTVCYSSVLLMMAYFFFKRKEFN